VIDIKPYIPYADSIPDATAAWAAQPPIPHLRVEWSNEAVTELRVVAGSDFERLYRTITDVIGHDQRLFHHCFDTTTKPEESRASTWNFQFGVAKIFFSVVLDMATISTVKFTQVEENLVR
jgi:hypothetical protein